MRIYSFNRGKSEFKRGYGLLAIVLASAFMWVALRTVTGTYNGGSVDISEFVLNSFLCVALIIVRGNVAAFFRYERPAKHKKGFLQNG